MSQLSPGKEETLDPKKAWFWDAQVHPMVSSRRRYPQYKYFSAWIQSPYRRQISEQSPPGIGVGGGELDWGLEGIQLDQAPAKLCIHLTDQDLGGTAQHGFAKHFHYAFQYRQTKVPH